MDVKDFEIENGVLKYYKGEDKGVTIPDGVTSIGEYAFAYCGSLENIMIPNSVTSIGRNAFEHCSSLTSVTIPNSVTSIGIYAFAYCRSLTSITIPDSVTSIGSYAFTGCSSLTSVTIGSSVISIESYAFVGCSKLTKVNYTGTIDQWVQISFGDYFANPLFYAKNLYINDKLVTEAVITTATEINDYAFSRCSGLTSITIPDSVTSIGERAFYNCSSLTSITIPDSITTIGGYVFAYCSSLTSVTIPDSVTSIGVGAFSGCDSLTKTTNQKGGYFKAFNTDLTCRDFQYNETDTFTCNGEIKLCENGFHACKNAFDLFNYYYGELGKDMVVYKVKLTGVSRKKRDDSKVVGKTIKLLKKINSYAELLN